MNKYRLVSSISALALFALFGCGGSTPQKVATAEEKSPDASSITVAASAKGIATLTVQTRAIRDYLEISGRVVPDPTRVVHVYPAAGGRLLEMTVRPWDRIEKGQTLALLESSSVSRDMADYQKSQVDSAVKKKALDRASDLYDHHAVAQKDLEQAQADWESAKQEEKATLDNLHLLGVAPGAPDDKLRVLAPRSGVVLDIGAAPGELSKAQDAPQPLCTVADLSTVWIEGDVFEKDVAALTQGATVEVTLNAYPGQTWTGRVGVVGDAVDPVTRTLKVRVVLANPQLKLKPDMFATIRVQRPSSAGISIPAASVVRDGNTAYVFVSTDSNHFTRREVTLGDTNGENVEVTSGLNAGAMIASEGALLLRATPQD